MGGFLAPGPCPGAVAPDTHPQRPEAAFARWAETREEPLCETQKRERLVGVHPCRQNQIPKCQGGPQAILISSCARGRRSLPTQHPSAHHSASSPLGKPAQTHHLFHCLQGSRRDPHHCPGLLGSSRFTAEDKQSSSSLGTNLGENELEQKSPGPPVTLERRWGTQGVHAPYPLVYPPLHVQPAP